MMHSFKIPGVGPKRRTPEVYQMFELGNYANFNHMVTSDFIHEMTVDAFVSKVAHDDGETKVPDSVIMFIRFDDLMNFMADMLEAVTTDIANMVRQKQYADVTNMQIGSKQYWDEAIREIIQFVDKQKSPIDTVVLSSNPKF